MDPSATTTQLDINGVTFTGYETAGVAAGNIYDSHVYRTSYGGACYEISLVVHVGNAGNYDPPVREFDEAQAFDRLMPILRSFRFE